MDAILPKVPSKHTTSAAPLSSNVPMQLNEVHGNSWQSTKKQKADFCV